MPTYQENVTAMHQRLISPLLVLMLCSSSLLLIFSSIVVRSKAHHIGAFSAYGSWTRWTGDTLPNAPLCEERFDLLCYSPRQYRQAYEMTSLIDRGFTGKGQTIVIIDSFGSPTTWLDLQAFDAAYGLPDPPSFRQLTPLGSTQFNIEDQDQRDWASETELDVQWAHVMAPGASIVVLTSPVDETQGVQGMPEFLKLEQYALDHHLGKIISQSWGTTENTLFTPEGQQVYDGFERLYKRALFSSVSVIASAGDDGTGNPDVNNQTYPYPTVNYPASSPWVTAVGGTSLYADENGNYQGEIAWNDERNQATGGGVSQRFNEPFYQRPLPDSDQKLLHGYRGVPDVSMNAGIHTRIPVYLGYLGSASGFYLFGGTSEGAPAWAGITAVINQYLGHPIGFLNPILYFMGFNQRVSSAVYHDITEGDNSQWPLPGYSATPGWDAVTGWGSPRILSLCQHLKYGFV